MKGLLILLLTLVSLSCGAKPLSTWHATDYECGRYAVWKESRNQPLKVQRAVLDVLAARVRKTGKGMCKMLRMRGQFPWARQGFKSVDRGYDSVYNSVVNMKPVFKEDSGYLFFNHVKHPWGRNTKRLGGLYFSQ